MTTKDKLLSVLNDRQQELDSQREMLESIDGLSRLDLDAVLYGDSQIDFDYLSHADVVAVIKAFGGKWTKTPNDNARVDYSLKVDGGYVIRCYAGEPPPNCRIIEEEVEIPAQPARKGVVRKLVCTETVKAEELSDVAV